MKLVRDRSGRVNAGILERWNGGIVNIIGLGTLHRGLDGNLGRELCELLVRPDWSRGSSFDRTRSSAECRVNWLLCGIRLGGWRRSQDRDRLPRQHVETWHRRRKRLHSEQRTRRKSGRNVGVGECAAGKVTESTDWNKQAGSSKESHFDYIAPRD